MNNNTDKLNSRLPSFNPAISLVEQLTRNMKHALKRAIHAYADNKAGGIDKLASHRKTPCETMLRYLDDTKDNHKAIKRRIKKEVRGLKKGWFGRSDLRDRLLLIIGQKGYKVKVILGNGAPNEKTLKKQHLYFYVDHGDIAYIAKNSKGKVTQKALTVEDILQSHKALKEEDAYRIYHHIKDNILAENALTSKATRQLKRVAEKEQFYDFSDTQFYQATIQDKDTENALLRKEILDLKNALSLHETGVNLLEANARNIILNEELSDLQSQNSSLHEENESLKQKNTRLQKALYEKAETDSEDSDDYHSTYDSFNSESTFSNTPQKSHSFKEPSVLKKGILAGVRAGRASLDNDALSSSSEPKERFLASKRHTLRPNPRYSENTLEPNRFSLFNRNSATSLSINGDEDYSFRDAEMGTFTEISETSQDDDVIPKRNTAFRKK